MLYALDNSQSSEKLSTHLANTYPLDHDFPLLSSWAEVPIWAMCDRPQVFDYGFQENA